MTKTAKSNPKKTSSSTNSTKSPVKKDGPVSSQFLYGYKDSTGKVVIPAQYTITGQFVDGYAPVQKNGVWGVIDKKGNWITEPKFEFISKIENELLIIRKNKQFGLAKLSGDEILPPKYDAIVSAGKKAAVVKQGGSFSVVTLSGKTLVDGLSFASKWTEGIAVAATEEGVGLVDEEGKWTVKPSYDAIYDYSEGLAAFEQKGRSGYLDLTGNVAIKADYDATYDFSEGLARVQKDGKFGYINNKGQLVIPCVWNEPWKGNAADTDKATRFLSGLAEVAHTDDELWHGYIDTKGKWFEGIPDRKPKPQELESFREMNKEWETAQEAVVLGDSFDKKLAAFESKLEKAMEKDRSSVVKAFEKIMKDYEKKKLNYLDLMIYDTEDFSLMVYEDGEGDPSEFHPFKAIAKVFEGGVMEEPTIRKAVERLRKFDNECTEKLLDWCVEAWKESGGAKFKTPAYIRPADATPYVDLKTGKRVQSV